MMRGQSVGSLLIRSASAVAAAAGLERGLSFLGATLAARVAGPETFGRYSIVVATAGTVAAYAGAGIGTTANRFAGQYAAGTMAHRGFVRALAWLSLACASTGAAVLAFGSGVLARLLLLNEGLADPLKIAGLLAAGTILLDSCRGALIGRRDVRALLLASVVCGVGLLVALPIGAGVGVSAMIGGHAGAAWVAVFACVLWTRGLGGAGPSRRESAAACGPGVRSLLAFGMAQLGGVVGLNIAAWWLASLVARVDTSLAQMGLYAVASQLRGLASIMPGLFAQVGYPLLTDEGGRPYGGARRVLVINSVVTSIAALVVSGLGIAVLPWALPRLFGEPYLAAEVPAILLLAAAIVHMGGAPAANRMYVSRLRAAGLVNAGWAALVIAVGSWWVPLAGATGAGATLLLGHIVSQSLVLVALRRSGELSRGLVRVWAVTLAAAVASVGLACLRVASPSHTGGLTLALVTILAFSLLALIQAGRMELQPGDVVDKRRRTTTAPPRENPCTRVSGT